MWMVSSWQNGDEVLYWSAEYTHGWGHLCSRVRSVSVLEDCFLECIDVDGTILANIASDQPFDGFDSHFGSAVAVWEGN